MDSAPLPCTQCCSGSTRLKGMQGLLTADVQQPHCSFIVRCDRREQVSFRLISITSPVFLQTKKSSVQECYCEQYRDQGETCFSKTSRRKFYSTFNCWVNSLHSLEVAGNNLYVRFTYRNKQKSVLCICQPLNQNVRTCLNSSFSSRIKFFSIVCHSESAHIIGGGL